MLPSAAYSSSSSSRYSDNTSTACFQRQMAIMLHRGENDRVNDNRELLPCYWPPTMLRHDDEGHLQSISPTMHHHQPAYLMHLESGDTLVGKTTCLMPNYNTGCNNNNSAMILRPDLQCNSNSANRDDDTLHVPCPNKKRKAEPDLLEEKANDNNIVNDKNANKAAEAEEFQEGQSEITTKTDRDNSTNTCSKVSEAQKPDYIHVRARRGQATDSHSLAERARREKISKKMKCLQDLVPGCERVTGKAGMLDEIINYVQSLQKQVEFLSMKLATLKPRQEFCLDSILAQEIPGHMTSLMTAKLLEGTNSSCFPYNQMNSSHQVTSHSHQKDEGMITSSFIDPPSNHQQLQHLSGWDSEWPNNNPFNFNFH